MSMPYAVASVFTLKCTVSPRLTLICVAKPWIDGSPAPLTSHWLGGLPGRQFSATIGIGRRVARTGGRRPGGDRDDAGNAEHERERDTRARASYNMARTHESLPRWRLLHARSRAFDCAARRGS